MKNVDWLYANTTPFSLRHLSICGFGICGGVLEPISRVYQGLTVLWRGMGNSFSEMINRWCNSLQVLTNGLMTAYFALGVGKEGSTSQEMKRTHRFQPCKTANSGDLHIILVPSGFCFFLWANSTTSSSILLFCPWRPNYFSLFCYGYY